MGGPSGHTLFTDALGVIGAALEAHRDEPRWCRIIERSSGPRGPVSFGVEVYEPDPEHIVDRYLVQIHDGRFEIVEQGRIEPVDWRVSADELRHLVAEGEAYARAPQRLDLRWLEVRLGIVPRLTRAGTWRVGRVRRPSATR